MCIQLPVSSMTNAFSILSKAWMKGHGILIDVRYYNTREALSLLVSMYNYIGIAE